MLSVTTDYAADQGCPEPALRRIAEAGFTHVHWCHQWNTDFLYADAEIEAIETWMREYHLALTDLHASDGKEKRWTSLREYERKAGVQLVENRMAMAARLGADVIIMHLGTEPDEEPDRGQYWSQLWRSLDELETESHRLQVRIAVENGRFPMIRKVFDRYDASYVGLCYDCGHGNLVEEGLDELEALKERLISVHLHDNDGTGDQHRLLFTGTVDWDRLARIIARSPYDKPMNLEVSMKNSPIEDEALFLQKAWETGTAFSEKVTAFCREKGKGCSD